MKRFGYVESDISLDEVVPSAMGELTLCASPDDLRLMVAFLNHCASEMERMGATYENNHLSDQHKQFRDSPHFVVCRE